MTEQDSVSKFVLTQEDALELKKIFHSDNIEEKMEDISKDITYNITKIYGRRDIIIAIDLVYHSVLSFKFQNRIINKGWLELLILGDTRTGKTEAIQNIIKHYQLGEFVTGENTSYAGLVGGLQQTQKKWSITWGKIPLNDRKLVVIDECSGLNYENIANMSGVRSTGVAELTKIQTERTNARTRLIWISNPRSNRILNSYSFGVEAIPELIGKPEDIARFDFAITNASEEVDSKIINAFKHKEYEHKYKSEYCKKLILWIWSRKKDDIVFEKDAVESVLKYSYQMGKEYISRIPLIESADQRIKLAKLGVAVACRVFNTDENFKKVIVEKKHIDYAYKFLNYCYKKESLGYYDYSQQIINQYKISEENIEEIKEFIKENSELINLLMSYTYLRKMDIQDMLGLEKTDIGEKIKFLIKNRLITNTSRGYIKNPNFIRIIKNERI